MKTFRFAKTCLCSILLFSCFFAVGQEEDLYTVNGRLSPWSEEREANAEPLYFYTLVTDANLREKPSSDAVSIQKLPIATKVKIEEITKNKTVLNGFEAPWYKIKLDNGKIGYLWAGTLSAATLVYTEDYNDNKGLTYLVGIANYDEKKHKLTLQVRTAKNGKELMKTEFITEGDLTYDVTLKGKNSNMGFDKVKDVIEVNTSYGACGYASGDNLLFLQDKKLQRVLETSSVSDAGAFYSSENALLPQDKGGIGNHVVVIKDEAEMGEKNGDMVVAKQKYSIVIHKWNGDKLLKMKELK